MSYLNIPNRNSLAGSSFVRSTRFAIISSGTSGTIEIPEDSTIILDDFGGTTDAIISQTQGSRPTFENVFSSDGDLVGVSFDSSGNYTLSDTPDPSFYPIAIVYRIKQSLGDYDASDADLLGADVSQSTKAAIGLGSVDNTSDVNKPISTLQQAALDLKENAITSGTTAQYWRGDKSFQTLDKTAVGLSNVPNTDATDRANHTGTQIASTISDFSTAADSRISNAAGVTIATLDGAGKVPVTQLPHSIMEYKGTWNASTNTPTLADFASGAAAGTAIGDVYRVSVAGTINLGSGSISFGVGDYVICSAAGVWEKSDTTDAVSSVNGYTGTVTLAKSDIGLSNVPNTDATVAANITQTSTHRFVSDTEKTTWNAKEPAITAGTTLQYLRGDKSLATLNTSVVPESGNLYFTDARSIASPLTGFSSAAGTVGSSDSILGAMNKLDGNIALKAPIASPSFTGDVKSAGDLLIGVASTLSLAAIRVLKTSTSTGSFTLVRIEPTIDITSGASTQPNTGLFISPVVAATNTQNVIDPAALNGLRISATTTAGATGTFSNNTNIYVSVQHNATGLTITNSYNFFGVDPTGAGPITNNVGVRVQEPIKGTTTNVGFLVGTLPASGNYAFYSDSTYASLLSGALTTGPFTANATGAVAGTDEQITLISDRQSIASGELIGGIAFKSNDTNLTAPGTNVSLIQSVASATHTASVLDTDIVFQTTKTLAMSEVFRLRADGSVVMPKTITAGGTTGAQTINKPLGTVNFAAGASSLVVTNSLVDASSIVHCVVRTNDTTAQIKNVVCAAGSFTIRLTANTTAETSVGFIVFN